MRITRYLVTRFTLFLSILLSSVWAQAATLDDYLGEVTSLSAEFKQVVSNEQTKSKETTFGDIIVLSPASFRLTYTKPYKLIYVANGTVLWTYDEDLEQASVRNQENFIDSSPAVVLSNPANIKEAYNVNHVGKKDGSDVFHLVPIDPENNYDFVELGFRDNKMYSMRMVDGLGQETLLTFTSMDYNQVIDADTFEFVPPQGVDVINNIE